VVVVVVSAPHRRIYSPPYLTHHLLYSFLYHHSMHMPLFTAASEGIREAVEFLCSKMDPKWIDYHDEKVVVVAVVVVVVVVGRGGGGERGGGLCRR